MSLSDKFPIQALLGRNAKVYLAARSPQKAEAAIKELSSATGKNAIFLELDLSDLKAVKAAADEFLRCLRSHAS
jgi:NAD(P)-dependent dehydrogenase (short-subunit alcohol dehydrogenase family)